MLELGEEADDHDDAHAGALGETDVVDFGGGDSSGVEG